MIYIEPIRLKNKIILFEHTRYPELVYMYITSPNCLYISWPSGRYNIIYYFQSDRRK